MLKQLRAALLTFLAPSLQMGIGLETEYHVRAYSQPDGKGELLWEERVRNKVVTTGLNIVLNSTFGAGSGGVPTWFVGLVGTSITDLAITNGSPNATSATAAWTAADQGAPIIVAGGGAPSNGLSTSLLTSILTYSSAGAVILAANNQSGHDIVGAAAVWGARAADTAAAHAPWTLCTAYSNATRPAYTIGAIANGSCDNSGSPAVFNINADGTVFSGAFLINDNTKAGTAGTLYGMALFTSIRSLNNGESLSVVATIAAASVG